MRCSMALCTTAWPRVMHRCWEVQRVLAGPRRVTLGLCWELWGQLGCPRIPGNRGDGMLRGGHSQRRARLLALRGQGRTGSGHHDGPKSLPPLTDALGTPSPRTHAMSRGYSRSGFAGLLRAGIRLQPCTDSPVSIPTVGAAGARLETSSGPGEHVRQGRGGGSEYAGPPGHGCGRLPLPGRAITLLLSTA